MVQETEVRGGDRTQELRDVAQQVVGRCWSFLSQEERAKIISSAPIVSFNTEEVIIRQGDIGSEMYFILEGEAEVFRTDYDGVKQSRDVLTPESKHPYFGEIALITDEERNADVIARTPVWALLLGRDQYKVLPPQAKADVEQVAVARSGGSINVSLTLKDVLAIRDKDFQPAFNRWQSELYLGDEETSQKRINEITGKLETELNRRNLGHAVASQVHVVGHLIKLGLAEGKTIEDIAKEVAPLLVKAAGDNPSSSSDAQKLRILANHALHVVRILSTKYAAHEASPSVVLA